MIQSDIVMQYASAWAKATEGEIVEAIEGCWTPDSTYTDPITDTTHGPVELARAILGFQKAFPGGTLAPTSLLDVHHTFGRFSWQLRLPAPGCRSGDPENLMGRPILMRLRRPAVWFGPRAKARS